MPGVHAVLSPSSLSRVFKCPGSVYYSQQRANLLGGDPEESKEWAAEGTIAHEVRENCLRFGLDPSDFLGRTMHQEGFEFEITEEMVNALTPGIERIRSRPGRVFIEERVTFDRWMPGQFGTLDCGIAGPDLIEIDDLKYGAGVAVSPDDNPQLKTYALGFWDNIARHLTRAEDFKLIIDQPRASGGGGEWDITLKDLLLFGEELKELFFEVFGDDPEGDDPTQWRVKSRRFAPGEEQCRFCIASHECSHYAKHNLEIMQSSFDDLESGNGLVDLDYLTPEQKVLVALNKPLIESWLRKVYDAALDCLTSGVVVPGAKLVRGRRGARRWVDPHLAPDLVALTFGERYGFKMVPLTPTQVLDAPGLSPEDLKWIEGMTTRPDGPLKIAPEDSASPAVVRGPDMFDDDDETESTSRGMQDLFPD